MKFGLSMFGYAPRHYPVVAKAAEDSGFESVWMSEHLVFPAEIPPTYLYTESGYPAVTADTALFDPFVSLATIAQATGTIRLATNVYILPLRHPIVTARSVVTLDRVSNGRVTLGIGVGWLEEEFEFLGEDFHTRGARTDEIMQVLRELWTEDVIDHQGEHVRFGPVKFQPKPRKGIPIEVGGCSKPALRRAGRLGDGWIEVGARSLDELAAMIAVVEGHRADAGRQDLPFEISVSADWGRDLDAVRRAADLGATRVILGPPVDGGMPSAEGAIAWIQEFGETVIAQEGRP